MTRILSETGAIRNKGYSIDKSNRQGEMGYKEVSFGSTLGYNLNSLLCLGDAQTFPISVSSSPKLVVEATNSNTLAEVSTNVAIAPSPINPKSSQYRLFAPGEYTHNEQYIFQTQRLCGSK